MDGRPRCVRLGPGSRPAPRNVPSNSPPPPPRTAGPAVAGEGGGAGQTAVGGDGAPPHLLPALALAPSWEASCPWVGGGDQGPARAGHGRGWPWGHPGPEHPELSIRLAQEGKGSHESCGVGSVPG